LTKKDEFLKKSLGMCNDYSLETRKFWSEVNDIRSKLYKLQYKVKFIGAGDELLVISPDGMKKDKFRSLVRLREFIYREKIELD